MPIGLDSRSLVSALKAAAETTRLRILMLLAEGELSVKDLTRVLGQSQPRISRHLKLLTEAGLVERVREGSWAYFHLAQSSAAAGLSQMLIEAIDDADGVVERDRARLEALRRERVEAAQAFFRDHAADWDRIRGLHVDETEVEAAMLEALGPGPFRLLVDLGTGTGRMLELFAGRYEQAIGIDANQAMLTYARAKLDRLRGTRAQVRLGDILNLSLDDGCADAVVMHQVLHFLSDPARAIEEAARLLAPGGKLLIVDFAPHDVEFLRDSYAHVRLGVSSESVEEWLTSAGLVGRQVCTLPPPATESTRRLTVTIWMGERPPLTSATTTNVGVPALEELK
jgi:ArsR family transcriptional regulator